MTLPTLAARLRVFAAQRDWEQWHTPKNLAMALTVETAELAEQYQWLTPEQAVQHTASDEGRAAVADEIADVAIYLIRLADVVGIDLEEAILDKIARNETRFPPLSQGGET